MIESMRAIRALVMVLCLALVSPLLAEPPAGKEAAPAKTSAAGKFIRLQHDAEKVPIALETATVRYVPASGEGTLEVDLIGVVHIGDKDYYQKLNKQFEQYDVLLYELVAPQGTRVPKGGKREIDNPLALLQQMMKMVLRLDSQTEQVDYTKKNFVHADLSPQQMAEAMKERGEDAMTLILGVAADMMRQQNIRERNKQKDAHPPAQPDIDPITALLDPEGGLKLKRAMAQQLAETGDEGLGQTITNILITDRNKAALRVFQTEMAKGKKKIGIFYGAAHMPDFERRLLADFGLKRSSEQWLTAWDMKKQQRNGIEDILKLLK